jgi:hypothetical protein
MLLMVVSSILPHVPYVLRFSQSDPKNDRFSAAGTLTMQTINFFAIMWLTPLPNQAG